MSEFYVGQKVVCVSNTPLQGANTVILSTLRVGATYTLRGAMLSPCCGSLIVDVGVHGITPNTTCSCGADRNDGDIWWFMSHRFRPVDSLTEQIERIEEEGAPIELEPEYA